MASLTTTPVTAPHWNDLATLFRTSAVMRGCWCLWPRIPRAQMHLDPENEGRLHAIVEAGSIPGLLTYVDGVPAGWCALGPCAHFGRFFGEDAAPDQWLLACLFVGAEQRGHGVAAHLVEAAIAFAAGHGARRLDALPRGWRPDDDPATMAAITQLFHQVGFTAQPDPDGPARLCIKLS